ncbi:MAG: SuhR protein [Coriobacteriaceae bacterium]|nr:SuhR protein [Coriobacteriaceae bacterium]
MNTEDPERAYSEKPPLECDLIMKGGITSGVIYPLGVCRLAETYRLRNVGGTSAGAIAAGMAAAAETGRPAGFEALERLPDEITEQDARGESLLFRLFRPAPTTRPVFRILTAALAKKGIALVIAVFGAALLGFPGWVLLGALPGLALAAAAVLSGGPALPWALVGAVLALVAGVPVALAWGVWSRLSTAVPANGYGLCRGDGGPTALTPWLHAKLNELAGRPAPGVPLTFRDLWGIGETDPPFEPDDPALRLEMISTNLTRGTRERIPSEFQGLGYFYDPAQLGRWFPAEVMEWMADHPHPGPADESDAWRYRALCRQARGNDPTLLPLPAPGDLPVVVAVRMSLSFPLLISAVPLYAVDYSRERSRDAASALRRWHKDNPGAPAEEAGDKVGLKPEFQINWFSDGGLCSNFPVHFFDAPLPSRPTFGINLRPFHADHPRDLHDECNNVYLPDNNLGGVLGWWRPIDGLIPFASAIVGTMKDWVDNSQLTLSGYRDRIVHVSHDDTEGGMNLNMPPEVVKRLAERGVCAADALVDRFAGARPGSEAAEGWQNHRWVRYRTAMAGMEDWSRRLQFRYDRPGTAESPAYGDFFSLPMNDLPGYRWDSEASRKQAHDETEELMELRRHWSESPEVFEQGAPKHRPHLRLVPK